MIPKGIRANGCMLRIPYFRSKHIYDVLGLLCSKIVTVP